MKYRVVQTPKITGFLTSVSDCRPPCVLGNKFPKHLDFCTSDRVGYYLCVELLRGVLLLSAREKHGTCLEEEEKIS